jgi:hypothetical protein
MNRTTRLFTLVAALPTTVMALVLLTAGQAVAIRPKPGPHGGEGIHEGPSDPSALLVEGSVSALQWVLFAAAVIAALLVGAALMHLAQRHRVQLAH